MRFTRFVLGVAGVPLLSGCMAMGGMEHGGSMGGMGGMAGAGHAGSGRALAPAPRAEVTREDLHIALSVPNPRRDAVVAIEARVRTDRGHPEPADMSVRLRVQAPDGSVDQLPMQHLAAETYRAEYRFTAAGLYHLTAEAWMGTGTEARTVSVTTVVQVGESARAVGHSGLTPAALLLGGLGMVAMMAFMVGGSVH